MTETALPLEITPQDVQRRLEAGEKLALVDVRETRRIPARTDRDAELIPMRTVPAELSRLDAQATKHRSSCFAIMACAASTSALAARTGCRRVPEHGRRHRRWSLEIDPGVRDIPESFQASGNYLGQCHWFVTLGPLIWLVNAWGRQTRARVAPVYTAASMSTRLTINPATGSQCYRTIYGCQPGVFHSSGHAERPARRRGFPSCWLAPAIPLY